MAQQARELSLLWIHKAWICPRCTDSFLCDLCKGADLSKYGNDRRSYCNIYCFYFLISNSYGFRSLRFMSIQDILFQVLTVILLDVPLSYDLEFRNSFGNRDTLLISMHNPSRKDDFCNLNTKLEEYFKKTICSKFGIRKSLGEIKNNLLQEDIHRISRSYLLFPFY